MAAVKTINCPIEVGDHASRAGDIGIVQRPRLRGIAISASGVQTKTNWLCGKVLDAASDLWGVILRLGTRLCSGKGGQISLWQIHTWAAKIWLALVGDRHFCRRRATASKRCDLLNVIAQERIVTQISSHMREVIRVHETMVVPMLDHHVPTHKLHLEAQNSWVLFVI